VAETFKGPIVNSRLALSRLHAPWPALGVLCSLAGQLQESQSEAKSQDKMSRSQDKCQDEINRI